LRTSSASNDVEKLVVDANPILSGLIGGAALRVFWNPAVREFATTEHTLQEVIEYAPELARKAGRPEELLLLDLKLLPLVVYSRRDYHGQLREARRRIGKRDPDDVDLLALALKLEAAVWSNDRDYATAGVAWYTTARLLARLVNRKAIYSSYGLRRNHELALGQSLGPET
jgi:predicted nucleic acid-binding protein